jgi:hypothetical protein
MRPNAGSILALLHVCACKRRHGWATVNCNLPTSMLQQHFLNRHLSRPKDNPVWLYIYSTLPRYRLYETPFVGNAPRVDFKLCGVVNIGWCTQQGPSV